MKKILFLNSTLDIGGAEKMFCELVRHLDNTKFNKKVYCFYSPGTLGEGLISEGINLEHSLIRNRYDLVGIFKFFFMLKKEKADLLYIENSPLTLFWGFLFGKITKVPFMATVVHFMKKPSLLLRLKSGFVSRLILTRLDRVGVVSKAKMDSLTKEYRLRPEKVMLINNAIDIGAFTDIKDTNVLKKEIGIYKDEKIIGMVGRLVDEKAYDVFLRSAQKILNSVPESKFLVVGDGGERSALEGLAGKLGIREHVIFLGQRQDIAALVSLFDVAVLSSRAESFPVVLLEYMAASRPVVATNVGDNSKIISDNESGLLVPPEDPEALAGAVIELLNNNEKAKKMGIAARKKAESRFYLKQMIDKMERFFLDHVSPASMQHVIMVGPRLDVRGGISSFAKYCLGSDLSRKFKITYLPTTIDASKALKSFYFIGTFIFFLIRLISDRSIKIIHIYTASRGSFYRKAIILSLSKLFMKKTIFHIEAGGFDVFYNTSHAVRRFCIRRILGLSDTIVVLSKTWFSEVSRMTSNTNIKVIPNSVDTTAFESIVSKREYSKLNVLILGRLEHRKGTYDILDIVPAVLKKVPDAKFYFAGDGDVKKVADICRKRGLEENVILLGWLKGDSLLDALENASIFLLPSYNEGLPVAMLEAMASGLPVISTKVGAIPETVEDGINGFLVNPGEKQELAAKIVYLLKNRKLREKIGKSNAERIHLIFGLDRIADRIHAEYNHLLKL
ncbi:MAG: glycosyltransferase [Candidatus Omnitrophica bacterium]|nr:glycosyltransferase [Candidatus Omnitrophota bacterium]